MLLPAQIVVLLLVLKTGVEGLLYTVTVVIADALEVHPSDVVPTTV